MLIHYIIVRRDLPLGTLAAMITHAAGESAAKYAYETLEGFDGCTAVVLEAKSEAHLHEYAEHLRKAGIPAVEVHESSGPFAGEFMAIGILPGDRERLAPMMASAQCLKTLEVHNEWGV